MLTLRGNMMVTGAPVTIIFDALVRSRDSLRIDLTGPFDIPVGALSATPANFLFFNAQEAEAIEGSPDRETFAKLMQLDLEYDEMVSMLRGELPRFPAAGSYKANPFGLHDMNGGVAEWVTDCWNKNYQGAPADGSAWTQGNCRKRVLRGGSWRDKLEAINGTMRNSYDIDVRYLTNGFRVAREVN